MSPLTILVLFHAVSNVFGETNGFSAPPVTYSVPSINQIGWWNSATRNSYIQQLMMRPTVVNELSTGGQVRLSVFRYPVTKGYKAPTQHHISDVPRNQPQVLQQPSIGWPVETMNSKRYLTANNNIRVAQFMPKQVMVPQVSPTFPSQMQVRKQNIVPTTKFQTRYARKDSTPQYSVRRIPQIQDKIVNQQTSASNVRPQNPLQIISKPLTYARKELGKTQQSVIKVQPSPYVTTRSVQGRINIPQVRTSIPTPPMAYQQSPAINQVSAMPTLPRPLVRKGVKPASTVPFTLRQKRPDLTLSTPARIVQAPVIQKLLLRPNPEISGRLYAPQVLAGKNPQMPQQPTTIIRRNPLRNHFGTKSKMSQQLNPIPENILLRAASSSPINVNSYSPRSINMLTPIPQINEFQADFIPPDFSNSYVNPYEQNSPFTYPVDNSFSQTPNTPRQMITEENIGKSGILENNLNYFVKYYPKEDEFSSKVEGYNNEDVPYIDYDAHPEYNQHEYEQNNRNTDNINWKGEPYKNEDIYDYPTENDNFLDNAEYKTYNDHLTKGDKPLFNYHPEKNQSDIPNPKKEISNAPISTPSEIGSNDGKPMDRHVEKLNEPDFRKMVHEKAISESNPEESKLPEPAKNVQQKSNSFSDFLEKLSNPSRNVDNRFSQRMSINTKPTSIEPSTTQKVSEPKRQISLLDRIGNLLKENKNSGLPQKEMNETPRNEILTVNNRENQLLNAKSSEERASDTFNDQRKDKIKESSINEIKVVQEQKANEFSQELNRGKPTVMVEMKTPGSFGKHESRPNIITSNHPKKSTSQISLGEVQESGVGHSIRNNGANNDIGVDQPGYIKSIRSNLKDLDNKHDEFSQARDDNDNEMQESQMDTDFINPLVTKEDTKDSSMQKEAYEIRNAHENDDQSLTERESANDIIKNSASAKPVLPERDEWENANENLAEHQHSLLKNITIDKFPTFKSSQHEYNNSNHLPSFSLENPITSTEHNLSDSLNTELNATNEDVNIFVDKHAMKLENNPAHEVQNPEKENSNEGTRKSGLNFISNKDPPIHTENPNAGAAHEQGNRLLNDISTKQNTQASPNGEQLMNQKENQYHDMNSNKVFGNEQPSERNNIFGNDGSYSGSLGPRGSNNDSGRQTTTETPFYYKRDPKTNDKDYSLIKESQMDENVPIRAKEAESIPNMTPGTKIEEHIPDNKKETETDGSNTVEDSKMDGTVRYVSEVLSEPPRLITTENSEYQPEETITQTTPYFTNNKSKVARTQTTPYSTKNKSKVAHKPGGLYHFLFNKVQEMKKSGDIYKLNGNFPDEISTTTQSSSIQTPMSILKNRSEVSNLTNDDDRDDTDFNSDIMSQKARDGAVRSLTSTNKDDIISPTLQKSLTNSTQITNENPGSIRYIFVNGVRQMNPNYQPVQNQQGIAQYIILNGVWQLNPDYKPNYDVNDVPQYILIKGEWKINPNYTNPQAPNSLYRNMLANNKQFDHDDTDYQRSTPQYIVRNGMRYPNPEYKPQLNAAGVPNYVLINGIWQLNPRFNAADEFPPQYIIINGMRRLNPEWLRLQPYVWLNGEKIVNPDYVPAKEDETPGQNDTSVQQDSNDQEINSTIPNSSDKIPQYIVINGVRQLNQAWVQLQPFIWINGVRAPNPDYIRPEESNSKTGSKNATIENKNGENVPQYILINGYQQINPEWEKLQPYVWVHGIKMPNPNFMSGTTAATETSTSKPDAMEAEDKIPKYILINGIQNLNPEWVRLQPYIWVNGARMANPQYQPPNQTEGQQETEQAIPKYIDLNGTQVINPEWAKLQPFIWVNGVRMPNPNYQPSPNR